MYFTIYLPYIAVKHMDNKINAFVAGLTETSYVECLRNEFCCLFLNCRRSSGFIGFVSASRGFFNRSINMGTRQVELLRHICSYLFHGFTVHLFCQCETHTYLTRTRDYHRRTNDRRTRILLVRTTSYGKIPFRLFT